MNIYHRGKSIWITVRQPSRASRATCQRHLKGSNLICAKWGAPLLSCLPHPWVYMLPATVSPASCPGSALTLWTPPPTQPHCVTSCHLCPPLCILLSWLLSPTLLYLSLSLFSFSCFLHLSLHQQEFPESWLGPGAEGDGGITAV